MHDSQGKQPSHEMSIDQHPSGLSVPHDEYIKVLQPPSKINIEHFIYENPTGMLGLHVTQFSSILGMTE